MKKSRGGQKSNRSNKSFTSYDTLPISNYELDRIKVQVHINKETQEESVILLKRTMKNFIYHSDTFYRDKGSKRNNYVNEEAPNDKESKKFWK